MVATDGSDKSREVIGLFYKDNGIRGTNYKDYNEDLTSGAVDCLHLLLFSNQTYSILIDNIEHALCNSLIMGEKENFIDA